MKKTLLFLFAFSSFSAARAQYYTEAVDLSIGYGLSVPYDELDYFGMGFFAQVDYITEVNDFIDLRPYAGYILAKMEGDLSDSYDPGDKSTANAVLVGAKARFRYPVDWVAPFAEVGIGGSVGSFETFTVNTNIDKTGVFVHIPFSLGVELGPRHNFNLKLSSFYHPGVKQFAGALSVGYIIPISYY